MIWFASAFLLGFAAARARQPVVLAAALSAGAGAGALAAGTESGASAATALALLGAGWIAGAVRTRGRQRREAWRLARERHAPHVTLADCLVSRTHLASLPLGARVGEALGIAATRPHAWYPVHDGDLDRICGLAGLLDLVSARPADPVRGLLRPATFVPESQRPLETLAILRERGGGPVIVVDEHGRTEGLATAGDIAAALLGQPHRAASTPVAVPAEPGSWLVSGAMRRGEFEDAFGVRLPPGRYQTLGGLILWRLGRMPRVGEEVVAGRAVLTVMAATRQGVTAVKVTPPPR